MARPDWLREIMSAGNDFHYVKQSPWKHNLLNLSMLALVLCAYAAVLLAGAVVSPWIYIPIACFSLGCLIFSLFVLVIHECSHTMFVLLKDRDRSRRWNHLIGRVFASLLFTDYLTHWAEGHVTHHLHPVEEIDPQNPDPLDGKRLLKRYLLLLVPGTSMAINPSQKYGFSVERLLPGALVHGGLMVAGGLLIHWQVALVVAWSFNCAAALNLTKVAQEHASGLGTEPDPYLRSRTYFYPTRFLTSPFCINYHFEHHANFNVPWYRLRAYHKRMLQLMPAALHPYYLTRGLGEFFLQLAGKRDLPPSDLRHLLGEDATLAG